MSDAVHVATDTRESRARNRERRARLPIRDRDPFRHHHLVERAASVMTKCAPNAKSLGYAIGISEDRAREHFRGDTHSHCYRALELADGLAADDRCSALPLAFEILQLANAQLHRRPTDWLVRRFHELTHIEDDLERDENRASRARDLALLWEADRAEGAAQYERAEITAELRARRVDPFAVEWLPKAIAA